MNRAYTKYNVPHKQHHKINTFFAFLGRHSLLVYLLHLATIKEALSDIVDDVIILIDIGSHNDVY